MERNTKEDGGGKVPQPGLMIFLKPSRPKIKVNGDE